MNTPLLRIGEALNSWLYGALIYQGIELHGKKIYYTFVMPGNTDSLVYIPSEELQELL